MDLVDIDESGWTLQDTNRKHGKAKVGFRVRDVGGFSRSQKWTVIMAVGGHPEERFRHYSVLPQAGTDEDTFCEFLTQMMAAFPHPERRRYLLWDNLSSHGTERVRQLVHAAGHLIIPRPAYYPVDGPIEYVFNMVQTELYHSANEVQNDEDFENELVSILYNLHRDGEGFAGYFRHCGYERHDYAGGVPAPPM